PASLPIWRPTNMPMRRSRGTDLVMRSSNVGPDWRCGAAASLRCADRGRARHAIIAQPMNRGADALQAKAVWSRVQPLVPALTKTIACDPPLAVVPLRSETRYKHRCLACHCTIALIANGE